MKNNKKPLVGQIFKKIAKKVGAKIVLEPTFGHVGQIICPNGKIHYFRNSHFDLNPIGAAEIAKDKDYANFFMAKLNYPTIPGKKFYSEKMIKKIDSKDDIKAAWKYALTLGLPVVVKPNSQSQGRGVFLVDNERDFTEAFLEISMVDDIILVQKFVHGNDYRLVVLGDEVVSAYQRIPLEVVSDGKMSVKELFDVKSAKLESTGRNIGIDFDDKRIKIFLDRQGISSETINSDGEKSQLLFNANLSTGGESIDVTDKIHPFFRDLAIKLTHDMGLKFCGVDLIIEDDITKKSKYFVVEVNSSPGIDNYYYSGKKQAKAVESIYLKILKEICKLGEPST